jgi:signal transduction histidine kinase
MNLLKPWGLSSAAASAVLQFVLAALLAAAAITAGAYWVVSRNAIEEATRNAQEVAAIDGRGIVEPALTAGVLNGDPAATSTFDRLIRDRVLSTRVVRVKLFTSSGRVVYSDATALIGEVYPLDAARLTALRESRVIAEVSQLSRPQNRYDRDLGPLLEAYLPVRAPSGETLLFETSQVYTSINDDQRRIWAAFFPVLAAGILILFAVQVPLAWRLARNLDRARQDREALLRRALDASELERRRIARDLHDGVVQTLAGVAFSLSAASARRGVKDSEAIDTVLREAARATRETVRDLRSLIVEIAPPNLEGTRLEGALAELLAPLESEGIVTTLITDGLAGVDAELGALLYRAAQESIRNAAAHAGASQIDVRVSVVDGTATLAVHDDGRGFTAEQVIERQRQGHVGLAMLRSLVEDAGGELAISSRPSEGSELRVTVEVR